jgi:hypothetical protein
LLEPSFADFSFISSRGFDVERIDSGVGVEDQNKVEEKDSCHLMDSRSAGRIERGTVNCILARRYIDQRRTSDSTWADSELDKVPRTAKEEFGRR